MISQHYRFPRFVSILGSTDRHLLLLSLPVPDVGEGGLRSFGTLAGLAAHHHGHPSCRPARPR
jgi:hypothetical protein